MQKYFYYTSSLSSLSNWDYLGCGSQPYKRGHLLFGEATQLLSENTEMFFAVESIVYLRYNQNISFQNWKHGFVLHIAITLGGLCQIHWYAHLITVFEDFLVNACNY